MKLEIKHLAPYLPYGLKLKGIESKIHSIKDAEYTMFKISKGLNGNTIISGRVKSDFGGTFSIGEHELRTDCEQLLKPILRPMGLALSDSLNIDGEDIYFSTWVYKKTGIEIDRYLDFEIPVGNNDSGDTLYFPIVSSMAVYNLLLEYHFDLFGLIDTGLAIDIKSL